VLVVSGDCRVVVAGDARDLALPQERDYLVKPGGVADEIA